LTRKLTKNDNREEFISSIYSLEKKPAVISQMFNEIAPRYDLMNDLMSGFSHKKTRKLALSLFTSKKNKLKALDLATGTGDFTILMAKQFPEIQYSEIIGIDFSAGMLAYAKKRIRRLGLENKIKFKLGDILHLPFPDDFFDVLTIGYAIRNVVDIEKALKEIYRVTKPGGTFLVVEATPPLNKHARFLVKFYFEKIVTLVSKFLSSAPHGYSYFIKSVTAFDNALQFSEKLGKSGFKKVRWVPMVLGSVTVFQGIKPQIKDH
jgi:demethylmenaquinone methyltransferase/2-methoxy-6-polyprenyl-1,4-benzoquinol methylase